MRSAVLAVVALLLTTATACSRDASSVEPLRGSSTLEFPDQLSTIVVPVSVDIATLRDRLDEAFPTRLIEINERKNDCVPPQYAKVCLVPRLFRKGCAQWIKTKITPGIDCQIDGHVDRGALTIRGSGNVLELSLPVKASVTVRGRGEVGKHIQETAKAAINATAKITIGVSADWQPNATVDADFRWTDRAHLDVLGFRITIGDKVKPEIRKILDKIEREVPRQLHKLNVRRQAERAWAQAFTSVRLSTKPDVWLRFAPRDIALSKLVVSDGALRISAFATGLTHTFVGQEPENLQPTELPSLQAGAPESGGFNFFLPVVVNYVALEAVLREILEFDKARTYTIPGVGEVRATFKDVRIYEATDNELAIGLTMHADPAGEFFDAYGTVWLTGKPSIDNESKRVVATSLTYAAQTDNEATNLLIAIARLEPIRQGIEAALTYDFSGDLEQALAEANTALNRPLGHGFVLEGTIQGAGIESVVPTSEGLYLGLDVQGEVRIATRPGESS